MSIDTHNNSGSESETQFDVFEDVYPQVWHEIERFCIAPEDVEIQEHSAEIQVFYLDILNDHRIDNLDGEQLAELSKRSSAYYRARLAVELMPTIIDITRNTTFTREQLDYHIASIQTSAAGLLKDILASFQPGIGVSIQQSEEYVGIINEITPMALYSQHDTLLLPASHELDIRHKTDLIGYRFDKDGVRIATQFIQCKTDVRFAKPTQHVPLIHADDFNNRVNPSLNVQHDHETSALLVERHKGTITPDEEEYLEELSDDFWAIIAERSTDEYRDTQTKLADTAMRGVRFSNRISKDMLPQIEN